MGCFTSILADVNAISSGFRRGMWKGRKAIGGGGGRGVPIGGNSEDEVLMTDLKSPQEFTQGIQLTLGHILFNPDSNPLSLLVRYQRK